jgi:hypothetical protein
MPLSTSQPPVDTKMGFHISPSQNHEAAITTGPENQETPFMEKFTKAAADQSIAKVLNSKLESLPTELKLAIMQRLPSLDVLHDFALSSKSLHQVRVQHNAFILPYVLLMELGQFLLKKRSLWL